MCYETVKHELKVSRKGRKLHLQFESQGEIWAHTEVSDADEDTPVYRGCVLLQRLLNDGLTTTILPSDLYAMWIRRLADDPIAFSEDRGSQIGGMAYRLVCVDDVRIRMGGGWYDRYNEMENDHCDADGDDQTFRLSQLLSDSEARSLGLEHPAETKRMIVRREDVAAERRAHQGLTPSLMR